MESNEPWLIAGLGNPGPWFAGTRHNAGFSIVEHLAERAGVRFRLRGPRCRIVDIELAGRPVLLAKPLWTINQSGPPIAGLMRSRAVPVTRRLVVQDDLDFPFGTIRLKRAGGPGGHNGVHSVSDAIEGHRWSRRLIVVSLHRQVCLDVWSCPDEGVRRLASKRLGLPRRRDVGPTFESCPANGMRVAPVITEIESIDPAF